MWDKTITVFNKWFDKSTRETKLVRNIVKGVFFDDAKIVNAKGKGTEDADNVFCAIPFRNVKNYVSPMEYQKNNSGKVTFQEGDILVKGISGVYQTLKEIQQNNDYVYTITKVDTKDFGSMPHFEIGAK